jgi:hypothetical protein
MNDEEIRIAEMLHDEGKMIIGVVLLCVTIIGTFIYVALNSLGYL